MMQTKTTQVLEQFAAVYGVDGTRVYCLFTGKPIATNEIEELDSLIESLPTDIESAADDFAMRFFGSMRPSMRWNKMRDDSMDKLRKQAPVETMAYLLNRAFQPAAVKQSYVMLHMERIKLFARLCEYEQGPVWDSVMHQLLEIDARVGLHNESPPFLAKTILTTCPTIEDLAALLDPWHTTQSVKYAKAQAEAKYLAANPLARMAFFKSFMETKPATKAEVAKAEKRKERDFFDSLFDELTGSQTPTSKPPETRADKPVPVSKPAPVTKMPMRFGVKPA